MQRIRLDLAYDGTNFCGWQIQKNARTVQGVLEEKISSILNCKVCVTGSGRTDSGVHAKMQVAHFDATQSSIDPENWSKVLNCNLPKDIRIKRSLLVDENFHARYSAVERGYCYKILPLDFENFYLPFYENYCYATHKNHDLKLLNEYAAYFVGQKDFSSFCAAGDPSPSKERIVTGATFVENNGMIEFYISGNAFLWKMVRTIVGTILDLEARKTDPSEIEKIFKEKNRDFAGTTAVSKALFLDFVRYSNECGGTGFEYRQ